MTTDCTLPSALTSRTAGILIGTASRTLALPTCTGQGMNRIAGHAYLTWPAATSTTRRTEVPSLDDDPAPIDPAPAPIRAITTDRYGADPLSHYRAHLERGDDWPSFARRAGQATAKPGLPDGCAGGEERVSRARPVEICVRLAMLLRCSPWVSIRVTRSLVHLRR